MTDEEAERAERSRRLRNRIAWAVVLLSPFILGALFLATVYRGAVRGLDTAAAQEALTLEEVDLLLADLAIARELPGFAGAPTRDRNAAEVFGPLVGVDAFELILSDRTAPFMSALLGDRDQRKAWFEAPETIAELDADFWPRLSTFDHLDLREHGAWGRYLAGGGSTAGPDGALPFLVPLQTAAKVHWAAALAGRIPLAQAQADNRELARLLATEGSALAISMASAVLQMEGRALDAAHEPGDVGPMSPEQAGAPRRALVATEMVLLGRAPAGTLERLLAPGVATGFLCPAVQSALDLDFVRRSVLSPRVIFEPDNGDLFASARALAADCDLADHAATLDARTPLTLLEIEALGFPLKNEAAATPFVRSIYLRGLLLTGWSGPRNPYRER